MEITDIDMEVKADEVVALIGENGAGKSTLVKILASANLPSSGMGRILLPAGRYRQPGNALELGIAAVFQDC